MGWGSDAWNYAKKKAKAVGKTAIDPFGIYGVNDKPIQDYLDRSKSGAAAEFQGTDRGNFNLPGFSDFQGRTQNYLDWTDHRQGPQLGPQSDFRADQRQLSGLLMDRAQGKNSVAELQYRQAADMANAQQRSMMAGARPSQMGMAMRLGSQNMGRNMMDAAGGAAVARAQEANQAAMGLGGVLGQARGQDDARAMGQATLDQNQLAMNDAQRLGLLGLQQNAAEAEQRGGISYEQVQAGKYGAALGVPTGGEILLGGLSSMAPFLKSDEQSKRGVADGGQAADQFLGSLTPKRYEYNQPMARMVLPGELSKGGVSEGTRPIREVAPPGPQLGVMAQPVAQSPAAPAVARGPSGDLGFDTTAMTGPMLAGLGRLNERLQALESGAVAGLGGYGRIGGNRGGAVALGPSRKLRGERA